MHHNDQKHLLHEWTTWIQEFVEDPCQNIRTQRRGDWGSEVEEEQLFDAEDGCDDDEEEVDDVDSEGDTDRLPETKFPLCLDEEYSCDEFAFKLRAIRLLRISLNLS